jgi:hypothetical protein
MTIVQAMLPRPALAGGGLPVSHPEHAATIAIDEGQDGVPVHVGALRINIRYDHFGAATEGEQAAGAGASHTNNDNRTMVVIYDPPAALDQIQAVAANAIHTPAGAASPQESESLDAVVDVPVSVVVAAEADSEVAGLLDRLKAAVASNGGSGGAIAHSLASMAKSVENGVVSIGEWIFKVRS